MMEHEKIDQQRQQILNDQSKVELFAPCRIGEGILALSANRFETYRKKFQNYHGPHLYFIPASGSGSRMFDFLYQFLSKPDETNFGQVERFMNHLKEFSFYHLLPDEAKHKINSNTIEAEELVQFLMDLEGLNFGNIPKALIPFHYNDPFILNPLQEQILQGVKLSNGRSRFHFTIQPEHLKGIQKSVENLQGLTGKQYDISFSNQNPETESYTFDKALNAVKNADGTFLRRPSGHGALIDNLNAVNEEVIFIKNIDNVQHYSHSTLTQYTWEGLGGLLLQFKDDLKELSKNPSLSELRRLNAEYEFLSPDEVNGVNSTEELLRLINRPTRVCGMVRNEGQPGGGPFWINDNGRVTKQIVEKSQIRLQGDQFRLMVRSTHFNPVLIALSTRDLNGNKIDLKKHTDANKYFVVQKEQKGQPVQFIEMPGLWNGGMADWNTLFVEVSQKVFTPVKNVLDLLDSDHQA